MRPSERAFKMFLEGEPIERIQNATRLPTDTLRRIQHDAWQTQRPRTEPRTRQPAGDHLRSN